jgi:hypothetical protein
MAVTTYSAEYAGGYVTAEAAAEPFGAELWGAAPAVSPTAPVITPIAPALNANLDPYAPVSFSIASSVDLSSLVIWAKGGPRSETIYDATAGVGAQPGYPLSIVSGGGTTTVTIRCTDGWPAGTKIYVSTSAGGAFAVNP